MDNQVSTPSLPPTRADLSWSSTKVYTLGVICLVLGIVVGALFKGASTPAAGGNATQQAAVSAPSMPGGMPPQAPPDPVFEKVKEDPKNFDLLAQAGVASMKARDPKGAIGYYQRALDVKDDPLVRTNLGNAYFRVGDSDQALKEFALVLKSNPSDPNALFNSGYVEITGKNDAKEGIKFWETFLKTNPDHPHKGEVEEMLKRVKATGKIS